MVVGDCSEIEKKDTTWRIAAMKSIRKPTRTISVAAPMRKRSPVVRNMSTLNFNAMAS
jgi:hypothetical protein